MNRAKSANRLFLVLILISVAGPYLLGKILSDVNFYQSVSVSQTMYLLPVIIYVLLTGGEILEEIQLKLPKLSVLLLVVLFSVLLEPVMSCLNLFSQLFVENYVAEGMMELNGMAVGRNLMYIALVPALLEEFMFRGIFYHSYRPAGTRKAALCSGLCFGLLHLNLNQFLYAFILGVLFALLVEATGSVISSIVAHFVINSNSVFALALQEELEAYMGTETVTEAMGTLSRQDILVNLGYYTIMALICGVLAYGVFKLIVKWSGKKDQKEVGEEQKTSVITPCLILGIVAALAYMIIMEFLL